MKQAQILMKGGFISCLVAITMTVAQAQTLQSLTSTPPPNDLFSNAQVKTGYDWYAYGVTKGATHQSREPGKAIWYSWTAPASGPTIVRNWNEYNPRGSFKVYAGTNQAALKPVKPFKQNRLNFLFNANMGTTYYFAAERRPQPDDYVDLTLQLTLATLAQTLPTNSYYQAPATIPLAIVTTEVPESVTSVKYYAIAPPLGYTWPKLIAEADTPPYSAVWNTLEPGTWYIYGELSRTDGYVLNTKSTLIHIRPSNDDFADRKVLVGADITVNDSAAEATTEPGEPAVNGPDIWYSWTAPGDGFVYIPNVYGAMYEGIHIYKGSTLATLVGPITTMDHAGNDRPFVVAAGETLQIAVNGGDLLLKFYGIPTNDNFAAAIQLSGTNAAMIGNNKSATAELGEPVQDGNGGHTVWYTWQAPENGMMILQGVFTNSGGFTDIGGSSGSLVATVYTGDNVTNLFGVSTNYVGVTHTIPRPGPAYISVRGGTTYHIALDTGSTNWEVGNLGDFGIQLGFAPAPSNDDFANRIELTGNDVHFDYSSLGATIEPGEPANGFCSRWWTWTAPYAGTAMISGVQYSPVNGNIYTGDSVTNLTLVAARGIYFFWGVEAGKTYQLAFSEYSEGLLNAGLHLHYYTNGTPVEP